MTPRQRIDADTLLVRRTARRVGLWIMLAFAGLVVLVLVLAFTFVVNQIPVADLLDPRRREEAVDVGGLEILVGALAVGVGAIALAGTLGWFATRRAVAPLADALARQRRFVADASHELRTPLAILDARLQVLDRSLTEADPHREIVYELRQDSRNLIAVLDDLLDTLDMEPAETPAVAGVDTTLEGAVASMRMLAADRSVNVTLKTTDDDDVAVAMPSATLHRIVVALLDNAIKHSPPGGNIRVIVRAHRNGLEIEVADQGRGVQGIDPERMFDRFARSSEATDGGGSSRTGFGIGLALVHDAVSRAGGVVRVAETSASGTTIVVRLPRADH